MIDLRSDTLTRPTSEMRKAMYDAEVGDSGRMGLDGREEDPTVNKLEDLAAQLTGKEASMFVPSGTMGNLTALWTFCPAGQHVGVENTLHVYLYEKAAFMNSRFGGLVPKFFETDQQGTPDINSVELLLDRNQIRLLCLENSHNFSGGKCLNKSQMGAICLMAKKKGIPIHLDGARVNNAAIYLNMPVSDLVKSVDTVMFCLSKGLGAPVGSMLCGPRDFIVEAKKNRKLIGGTMRQAGVLAAAGIVAINKERDRLAIDHENARLLAERISSNDKLFVNVEDVQTNIIRMDVSPSGCDARIFQKGLEEKGLRADAKSEKYIRLVTYREIQRDDIIRASDIINRYCDAL